MDPLSANDIETLLMEKKHWETEFHPFEVEVQNEDKGTCIVILTEFIGVGI